MQFDTEGHLRPLRIHFDNERVYEIEAVQDICRHASDVGGVGDRYTCTVVTETKTLPRYLWLEKGKWFVEALE